MRCLETVCKRLGLARAQQLLDLGPEGGREAVLRITQEYLQQGKATMARQIRIAIKGFFEANDKELKFKRGERIRKIRKKVAQEIIPDKETVYRMVDALKSPRDKAIILCLFQSGVRVGCLVNWTVGLVRDQLYPEIKVPVRIRITNGIDTKLAGYGLDYYYTFLQREAAEALRAYLDQRIKAEGGLRDGDPLFAPKAKHAKKRAIDEIRILGIVKRAAKHIGLNPEGIWTHCLRKAFRKVLNASDIDEDTKEALMGHLLPGSRGNYFDYHDVDEIAEKYMRADFGRGTSNQIRKRLEDLERELAEWRARAQRLEEIERQNEELRERLAKLEVIYEERFVMGKSGVVGRGRIRFKGRPSGVEE